MSLANSNFARTVSASTHACTSHTFSQVMAEPEESSASQLPVPSPESSEKRTSWINENFDEVALLDETTPAAGSSEEGPLVRGGSPTTALSTAVGEPHVEDRPAAGDGALLEVEPSPHSNSQQHQGSSHRTLPAQPRPTVRLMLRPPNDTTHHDLQVSVTAREKHIVSKTDSYFIYQVETKVRRDPLWRLGYWESMAVDRN